MKKYGHSKMMCLLLALILLMQNMTVSVAANEDGTMCTVNEDGKHTIVDYEEVAATCTTPGYTGGSYCSACNAVIVKRVVLTPYEHKETEEIDPVDPTCTEPGYGGGGKRCTICHEIVEWPEVIYPAKGHTSENIPEIPAGCKEDGWTEGSKCSVCDEVLVAPVRIPAGHKKVVTEEAVAATCTTDGRTEGWKCEACGYEVVSEVIPATGHTEVIDPAEAATCTTPGKTEGKHCSVCGDILVAQEEIKATGHTVVIDAAVDATCTTEGKTEGKHCSVCDEILVKQEVIKAKGHKIVKDKAVAATCGKTGLTEGKHCSVCKEVILAQSKTMAKSHFPIIDVAVEPTCGKPGKTQGSHCINCGTIITPQREIPQTNNHQYVSARELNPDAGCTTYTCKVCGDTQEGYLDKNTNTFVPFAQIELNYNPNTFQLTAGDSLPAKGNTQKVLSEIKAGKLMVYKNLRGDSADILCLMSEKSSLTYLSAESGEKKVSNMIIASQNNPDGGSITVSPSTSVDQIGLGMETDKNGKSSLYVIEDGKESLFKISDIKNENGRNQIILDTENESRISIASDSIKYQIQNEKEDSDSSEKTDATVPAASGTRLEIDKNVAQENSSDSLDTSSDYQEVEIVFSVKDLSDPEEQTKNEIQVFKETESQQASEKKIEEVTENTEAPIENYNNKTEATNFIDIIEVESSEKKDDEEDAKRKKYMEESYTNYMKFLESFNKKFKIF
ncbi:MAG: hypothetical protein SOX32_01435 [Candidatus Choladocola sp.]|nr:hypothetical protein [Candidatus Choladocola sp.]